MTDGVVIVGAGPAGLTAGRELARRGIEPILLERGRRVGGIARTEEFDGYRFDIGGHRFYTKVEAVERIWRDVLGADFRKVARLSRIYYDGRFFNYPLSLSNALANLGPSEGVRIGLSYARSHLRPISNETNFEHWVTNRFGERLYRIFFKTYTEKVWGVPCTAISADWAAQRIKGLSLRTALSNALFRTGGVKSLIEEFDYPTLGPGMMWEAFQREIEQRGGQVRLSTDAVSFARHGNRVRAVLASNDRGTVEVPASHVISSMPLPDLLERLDPPPPDPVLAASRGLSYRALILVGLIVGRANLFPDTWIYVHSPDLRVGRIQNFMNWSPAMVPDPNTSSLGLEYFCTEGDEVWSMGDDALVALATSELEALGFARSDEVIRGIVIRQPAAYPVYDATYLDRLATIRAFLPSIENLQTVGRNGLHRYNNQDHSMLTALLAVENLFGASHDLWEVNTERSYYEEMRVGQGSV